MGQDTALAISDTALIFYEGSNKPRETEVINYSGELQGYAYNDKYVALSLKKSGGSDNQLQIYKLNGRLVMSTEYEGEYTNLKIADKGIILYEDKRCLIYNMAGIQKFRGTMEKSMIDMFAISGINKYMTINADGFEEIRLAK